MPGADRTPKNSHFADTTPRRSTRPKFDHDGLGVPYSESRETGDQLGPLRLSQTSGCRPASGIFAGENTRLVSSTAQRSSPGTAVSISTATRPQTEAPWAWTTQPTPE